MSNIVRRPTPTAAKPVDEGAMSKFIAGAPDAARVASKAPLASKTKCIKMIGHQAQITLALPPELLDKVNHMAGSLSISRAAFIKQALTRAVNANN
jgi:hypothetical protein